MTWLDDIVDFMADEPGKPNMVHPFYYFLVIIPMWLMVNPKIELELIIAVSITLNSYFRIMYPSQYNPGYSSHNHILSHPFFSRTLATIAEVSMYWIWARWVN